MKHIATGGAKGGLEMTADKTDGRRHSLNTRTTRELRDRLEEAAAATGRSLAQEVEARLEKSFAEEDILLRAFGAPHDMLMLRALASALRRIQTATGERWSSDFETLRQCQMAVEQILFGLWGGSRRDHPRKSKEYAEKVDARFPPGVELASWAVQHAMSEMGLGFPHDPNENLNEPPKGSGVKRVLFDNKGDGATKR